VLLLQQVPYKGSLPTAVPTDPLIYRFYELVNVYGTTFKALIHEEFGDGIMSAIDFKMDLSREPDPKGDRVRIVMSASICRTKLTKCGCPTLTPTLSRPRGRGRVPSPRLMRERAPGEGK